MCPCVCVRAHTVCDYLAVPLQYMYPVLFLQTYLRQRTMGEDYWAQRKLALDRALASKNSRAAELYNRNAVEAYLAKKSEDFLMQRGAWLAGRTVLSWGRSCWATLIAEDGWWGGFMGHMLFRCFGIETRDGCILKPIAL